jgi:hypothetical protein
MMRRMQQAVLVAALLAAAMALGGCVAVCDELGGACVICVPPVQVVEVVPVPPPPPCPGPYPFPWPPPRRCPPRHLWH